MYNSFNIEFVIISYNTCQLVANCIDSIFNTVRYIDYTITVFDNNSSDNTIEHLILNYPQVKIFKSGQNLGYAKPINMAVAESNADFIIVTNSDVEFYENSIETLTTFLAGNPTIGLVGPQQVFPDGAWQRSYGYIPGVREGLYNLLGVTSFLTFLSKRRWQNITSRLMSKSVPYIDGAVLVIRRSSFDAVGGFDEDFFFYSEDADFCHRLKKTGWDVRFVPSARVMHLRGGSSRNSEAIDEKYLAMQLNSKLLLLSKHSPEWHLPVYIILQALHFLKLYLVMKSVSQLTNGTIKKSMTVKAETCRRLKSIWGNQLTTYLQRKG